MKIRVFFGADFSSQSRGTVARVRQHRARPAGRGLGALHRTSRKDPLWLDVTDGDQVKLYDWHIAPNPRRLHIHLELGTPRSIYSYGADS